MAVKLIFHGFPFRSISSFGIGFSAEFDIPEIEHFLLRNNRNRSESILENFFRTKFLSKPIAFHFGLAITTQCKKVDIAKRPRPTKKSSGFMSRIKLLVRKSDFFMWRPSAENTVGYMHPAVMFKKTHEPVCELL